MKSTAPKKFVMLKENVTLAMVKATHNQFWYKLKEKPLRVLTEDKSEVTVRDADGEQYSFPKHLVNTLTPAEING